MLVLNQIEFFLNSEFTKFTRLVRFFPEATIVVSSQNIIIKQKKAIQCVADAKYNAHTGPLFKQLKILPFDSLIKFLVYNLFLILNIIICLDLSAMFGKSMKIDNCIMY